MGRPVYLVALKEPNPKLWTDIKHKWGSECHHFVNETMVLIDPPEPTNSGDFSKMLGFTEKDQQVGVVVSLESPVVAAGRFYNDFWEWLRNHG